jgi:hypothetical protein
VIEEAIQRIAEMSKQADRLQSFHPPEEPAGVYFLREAVGQPVKLVTARPQPRGHNVRDLDSFVACVTRLAGAPGFGPRGEGEAARPHASVWVSRDKVVALCDDADRRDRVTLQLTKSPQMETLEKWSRDQTFLQQEALVRVLRNVFARSVAGTPLLQTIRRLRWEQSSTTEAVVQHGKGSVGRAIEGRVTGTAEIPEDVTFEEHCFAGGQLGSLASVACTVEIDTVKQSIAITPLAGAVEEQWREEEESIVERLTGAFAEAKAGNVHVYLGAP